jgi:NAD(P)-dependent dehydrogenase (short-subunit alcohol dehydrogenase family)
VAIVTGGASGIGRALCEALARRRCQVIVADMQSDLAAEVADTITRTGGNARAARLDVTDRAAFHDLVRDAQSRVGRLDYLFNNAGIYIAGNAEHYGTEDWTRIIDINLCGVVHGVQVAYPLMMAQGYGHIINTASMAGLLSGPGAIGYATTKFAVVGLSRALRAEACRAGVRVSVLCPGVIRTPLLEGGGKYGRQLENVSPAEQQRQWESLKPMAPEVFARQVLDAVARNEAVIIVPRWWRLLWWLARVSPALEERLMSSAFANTQRRLARQHD